MNHNDYILPGEDGYPHERDERGWCKTCHTPPSGLHVRCVPSYSANTKEDA